MNSSSSTQPLRLLAVMAHPHDITHVAGTCAHHINRGDSVTAVSVTGGVRTHNENLYDELLKKVGERNKEILSQSPEEYGEQKGREMIEVCRLFGITDVRILPFSDQPLRATDELVHVLVEILSDVRPHILLTHAPYNQVRKGRQSAVLGDHVSAGIAMQEALDRAGQPEYGSDRQPHRVAAIYYMGVEFSYKDIDVVIDVTDQAKNRLKAEMLFTTQAHTPELAAKRIEISCGYFGWYANVAYGEPFVRADRQVVSKYLMVTDDDIKMTEMSTKECFEKQSKRVIGDRRE